MMQVDVSTECEAYLAGRYVDLLAATWRAIPVWAWVNVLGHATRSELQEVASGHRWANVPELAGSRQWVVATGRLANDLLARAQTDERLYAIQRTRLIPLELELARTQHTPLSPSQLITIVRAFVADHPSAH